MSRLIQRLFLPAFVLGLTVVGCSRQTALVPPKIHYGYETCADCGMIINDPHYAAALAWRATPNGSTQTAVFDDLGCLLNWQRHHANDQVLAAWVKDVRTTAWLDASSALYVKSRRLETPMGWGIVAGANTSDFSALSVHQSPLTWSQLLKSGTQKARPATLANEASHND